jgi:hypothetical protein
LRALLVGGEVGLEQELLYARVVIVDPAARRLGRLAGEVLAGGIVRRVIEAAEQDAAGRVLLDVLQAPGAGGLLGGGDLVEVLLEPAPEVARLARAGAPGRRR